MRSFVFLLAVATIVAPAGFGAPAAAHSLDSVETQLFEREPYVQFTQDEAPAFDLVDVDGNRVGLKDLAGKVVVLNFIYASCPDYCPLQSDKIAEIQRLVNETPMRDLVQFVSITTDPVRDTPEVLKAYGPAHGLDPANWTFLTSGAAEPDATRKLAERYGLKFTPAGEGYILHGVVTFVIDQGGTIRARFHGLGFNSTNLVLYVNALTNDPHRASD